MAISLMLIARQIQAGIRHSLCACELPCSPRDVEVSKTKAEEEKARLLFKKVFGERKVTDRYGLISSNIDE